MKKSLTDKLQGLWERHQELAQLLSEPEAEQMLKDEDSELKELAEEELAKNKLLVQELDEELQYLLIPKDPNDQRNVYLEVRAGTGGDEAAIFSGDLLRMYLRYAENRGWQKEIISESPGEHGGYKEVIVKISGQDVYSHLKF